MTIAPAIPRDEFERKAKEKPVDDIEAAIAALAALPLLEYEARRVSEAKALGLRTSALDKFVMTERCVASSNEDTTVPIEDVVPWPDRVDGAATAEEVRAKLKAHVVFGSPGDADAAAIWIIGSYLMDVWRLWPKLMITSPTKQCGKSTLLEVLDALVCKGMIVSNTKSAGVFRAIEAWRPCLLLDEADTWMKDDPELAGILNSGHTRRTANVMRVVEKAGELVPVLFSTWTAMAIAGIGSQRDTLMSRSIIISLRRRLPAEAVQRLPYDLHERLQPLRRKVARWASDNSITIGALNIEPSECGNDRRRDNFTPLHRIAHVLGGVWPDRLAAAYALQSSSDDDGDEPAGVMLLCDLAGIFAERQADRLQSSELVLALVDMEERPWADWKHGRAMNAQSVARLLKPFDVKPRNAKVHGAVLKSYHRADVEAAFTRYAEKGQNNPLPRYRIDNVDEIDKKGRYPEPKGSGVEGETIEQKQSGSGVAASLTPSDGHTFDEGEI